MGILSKPERNSHQFQAVRLRTCPDEVPDGAIFHPLRNHRQGLWGYLRPHQRQQVLVFELLP